MSPEIKVVVCVLLTMALIAMLVVVWLIIFRLEDSLSSNGYKAILLSKICLAILCASAIYLTIWPLPYRIEAVTVGWFSVLAIGCISSAVGYYLFIRDTVQAYKEWRENNSDATTSSSKS